MLDLLKTGYRNVDDSLTKELRLSSFDRHYPPSFGKRATEAFYYVSTDPDCVTNLAAAPISSTPLNTMAQRSTPMIPS